MKHKRLVRASTADGSSVAPEVAIQGTRLGCEAALVLGALVGGTALRFYYPNPDTLWLDEACTVLTASRSPSGIIQALHEDGNPPLYYFLLHIWLQVLGDGEAGLRILSGIIGSILPAAIYLVGRALLGRTAALCAIVLSAFSPLNIFYSHEVRMYALVPVLALGFTAALMSALSRDGGLSWRRWAILVITAVALIWTYTFGRFVVAAVPIAWLLRGPRTKAVVLRVAAALFAIGVIDLLWLPVMLYQTTRGVDWVTPWFHPGRAPFESLLLFGAGYHHPSYLRNLGGESPVAWLSAIWLCVALGSACWFGMRDSRLRGHVLTLFAVIAGGIGLQYLFSVVAKPIYLVGRYEIGAYPAFALLLGAGAQAAVQLRGGRRRFVLGAIAGLLVMYLGLACITINAQFQHPKPRRMEERAAFLVAKHSQPGDVIITTGLTRATFEYYLRRNGSVRVIESYPAELATHLGWFDAKSMRRESYGLSNEARDLVARLKREGANVFLVEDEVSDDIEEITKLLKAPLKEKAISTQPVFNITLAGASTPYYAVTRFFLKS